MAAAKLLLLPVICCIIATVVYSSPTDINLDALKSQLPPEFANTNFTADDAKVLLKEKCKKVVGTTDGAESTYADIEKGIGTFTECLTSLVNVTAMQEEIEIAKPIGELDTVFVKYCSKRQQAMQCIEDFNNKIQPCLDKDEKAGNVVMMRVVTSLFNFVCYKGGDQIALFYAEKGPECFEENKLEISDCLNKTLQGYVPATGGMPDITTMALPQLVMGKKQCGDLKELEKCIVTNLKTCEEITPSNIVESMFKFIRNETECPAEATKSHSKLARNSASGASVVSVFLLLGLTIWQAIVIS